MSPDVSGTTDRGLTLEDLRLCFEGVVPAVVSTASATGTPNVTYLSRVRMVDGARLALSNQFFSKTTRNLAENPRASLLVIHPADYRQFRLTLEYERTARRGPLFERLRDDVDLIAELSGMQEVFKLRSADVYRVIDIEFVPSASHREASSGSTTDGLPPGAGQLEPLSAEERLGLLAELTARIARCQDLDTVVTTAVDALDEFFGYAHSLLMLCDERGDQLFTIASHGYPEQGVGSEIPIGEGLIGLAAARCRSVRAGNVRQMGKYSRTVRTAFVSQGVEPGREIPIPGLHDADSRVAVPMVAAGQLVGVLAVESTRPAAFDDADDALLGIVASVLASAIEAGRAPSEARVADEEPPPEPESDAEPDLATPTADRSTGPTLVRHFAADGSTFLDGDYLIKGVAGRILWSLLGHHEREGRVEFSNRELRLDPSLELPAYRDNLESRLILLKRRLDEREAPVRIARTGRGRFRLEVAAALRLQEVPPAR